MGNCLCRYACPRFRERRLWVCCAQLAGKLKESNLRALVYCEEESKESFLESSDGEEGRSSFNSQVSRSFNILDMGLGETRDKIDGLIDADLFALEGIAKAFDFPFWIGDSVCECQKHLIKEGRSGLLISDVLSEEVDRLASERLKLSVSRPFLRIYTVTWNMNGKKAALQDLAKLIGSSEEDHKGHDLLVVGLQEVPSCDVESVIVGALGDDYSLMASATMMSLQLFVIGRKHWEGYFQDLRVDKVGSGGFGAVVRRQKGAVAVSFKFKEASFLFIASHLSRKLIQFPIELGNHSRQEGVFEFLCVIVGHFILSMLKSKLTETLETHRSEFPIELGFWAVADIESYKNECAFEKLSLKVDVAVRVLLKSQLYKPWKLLMDTILSKPFFADCFHHAIYHLPSTITTVTM